MTGTIQNGKLVYENQYAYSFADELYSAAFPEDMRQILGISEMATPVPSSMKIEYDIHNPRGYTLVDGDKYEFEVIYFEDGHIAELLIKTN